MLLRLTVMYKATNAIGYSRMAGDRYLTAEVERPYHREPMVGEVFGIDSDRVSDGQLLSVLEVSWDDLGATLDLGRVGPPDKDGSGGLDYWKALGFKEYGA